MTNNAAVEIIISEYDINELYAIQEYGCNSEVAHKHAAYSDTTGFYNAYKNEIESFIEEHFGKEALIEASKSTNGDLDAYKNRIAWTFIEGVAQSVFEERTIL
tara:strand:+ start:2529 stop:2837 length:309 start_codon:yes stop_codon:yes gene_type:complete